MADALLEELGKRIKAAREVKGFSQAKLAEKLGISRPCLSGYENGQSPFTVDVAAKLTKILDCDFSVNGFYFGRPPNGQPTHPPAQLAFEFGTEYTFPNTTLRILPSSEVLLITAIAPNVKNAI